MYLLNLAWFLDAGTLPMGVSTPPKWSTNVPICFRNIKRNLVHGALIEAEILTSPLPMYLFNLAWFLGTSTLPTFWSTTSQAVYKCSYVSQEPPKKFGAWGPNRSWDIDLPTPQCFCSIQPSFECWYSACMCGNTSQSDLKMFLCVSRTSKKYLGHGALIEAEILTSPSPMYLFNLAQFLGTGTLPTCVSTPHK